MLKITIPAVELYDEANNQFINIKGQDVQLEHSLVSVSKWESVWKKPFLTDKDKTREETIDYIRAMTITQNVPPEVYLQIDQSIINIVTEYIDDPMTATTFSKEPVGRNKEIITSEVIYYWMIAFNIPLECQKWHLNRLLTLIKVCNIKNQPAKKRSRKDLLSANRDLNALRRAQHNTTG